MKVKIKTMMSLTTSLGSSATVSSNKKTIPRSLVQLLVKRNPIPMVFKASPTSGSIFLFKLHFWAIELAFSTRTSNSVLRARFCGS